MNTSPVDNTDRLKAATLVAQWLEGSITNWDFEDEWPELSDDLAVVDIGIALWPLYNDNAEEFLGVSRLSGDELALLKRCYEFLRSSESYIAVAYEEAVPWKADLFSRVLGVRNRPWETMRMKIDSERQHWWPFESAEQFRRIVGGNNGEGAKVSGI
jgi:hypothetical protein